MSDLLEDKLVLTILKEIQKSLNAQNVAMLEAVRYVERVDRRVEGMGQRLDRRIDETNRRIDEVGQRITELKDDFSVILKAELGGAMGHLELRLEQRFSRNADDGSDAG